MEERATVLFSTGLQSIQALLQKQNPSLSRVSYIIPLYNQGETLFSAVHACHLSYCGPKEVIIINDGSTAPKTDIYLAEIQEYFPETLIHSQGNKKLPGARNAGIKLATGDFIQFLDADDLLLPGKVTYQVAHLLAIPHLDISITDWSIFDVMKGQFEEHGTPLDSWSFSLKDFLFHWERGLTIPIHAPLFRARCVKEVLFEEGLYGKEDWIFWCSLAAAKIRMGWIDLPGAIYRIHPNMMTRSQKKQMAECFIQASDILAERYGKLFPDFQSATKNWYKISYLST